ncbi:alpha-2-macroglobulin-like protein 1 [Sinocyclocheilus grahami]|uniref:alpha-2-macroglobulin-like protein 1 n=1 Tax=Sinocyclocheilus grahami TaxID=75366 RepID=UPI0007AD451B|nr:PREDICTED: alpha-2-macroglobulin-like protein 1 [Sinocyclocheilus grahami]
MWFDLNRIPRTTELQDNRLLYQEKPLKSVPGRYSVSVKGSCCVACFYNIPTPVRVARSLSVEVKVTGDCQGDNLMVNFTVTYDGPKSSTNMVLVDIKLLSGFSADTSLLGSPPNSFVPLVERVDAGEDHVLVHLKEVPKGVPMTYSLLLKQILTVKNLKPAVISVYDYYEPSDSFETKWGPMNTLRSLSSGEWLMKPSLESLMQPSKVETFVSRDLRAKFLPLKVKRKPGISNKDMEELPFVVGDGLQLNGVEQLPITIA